MITASGFTQLCEYGLRPAKGRLPTPLSERPGFLGRDVSLKVSSDQTRHVFQLLLEMRRRTLGPHGRLVSYISNGAPIKAASRLGLAVEELPEYWPNPNALVGVHRSVFKRLLR